MLVRLVARSAPFPLWLLSVVIAVPLTGTAQITEVIDATGDGGGEGDTLGRAVGVAVDGSDNVYVTG